MLVEVLDEIESRLVKLGSEVLRGPQTAPGKKLVYSKESHTELFGRAEVMMFSSRSICSREIMLAAPRLRGIVNPTIGLETVDLAAANELGIIVGHGATPENFLGMAEATVMLILMLMYQPRETEAALRDRRRRPRPTPKDAWARMLRGRTVGLVGLGRIALDSFAVEPLPDDSPLRQLDNVILTPHRVGHTQDAFASFPPAAVENITRILRGEPPLYCKNPGVIPAWKRRLANLGT